MLIHQTVSPLNSAGITTGSTKLNNSPLYSDGRYNHNSDKSSMSFTDAAASAWDFLFSGNNRTPDRPLPSQPVDLSWFNHLSENQLNVTWLGHSSLMINIDGFKILTDPVFEKRVSILGPTRFNGEMPIDINQLPQIDAMIISHNHYDHLNKFSVLKLKDKTNMFIVPLGVGARLIEWGVAEDRIVELNWLEEHILDNTEAGKLRVIATPAQHFSGRSLTDRNKTLWASWVIKGAHHNIFFSGDSGFFSGLKEIGETYGPFNMTFIECGAYNEAWHGVHMFPEETVKAHLDLKGHILHPIHWATFNLSLHPWYEPMQRLTAAADAAHVKTATPVVGETTVYDTDIADRKWWKPIAINSQG